MRKILTKTFSRLSLFVPLLFFADVAAGIASTEVRCRSSQIFDGGYDIQVTSTGDGKLTGKISEVGDSGGTTLIERLVEVEYSRSSGGSCRAQVIWRQGTSPLTRARISIEVGRKIDLVEELVVNGSEPDLHEVARYLTCDASRSFLEKMESKCRTRSSEQ